MLRVQISFLWCLLAGDATYPRKQRLISGDFSLGLAAFLPGARGGHAHCMWIITESILGAGSSASIGHPESVALNV